VAKLMKMDQNNQQKGRPMYTSYFSNSKNFPTDVYQPISIAQEFPKYVHYFRIHQLVPPKAIARYQEQAFIRAYRRHLDMNINAKAILIQIAKICGDKIPVLLATERPEKFSHRHIVRDWLIAERNVNITELGGMPVVQLNINFNLK